MRNSVLILGFAALVCGVPGLAAAQQAPALQIQNGKVEARSGANIDRELAAVAPLSNNEPVWLAWRAPMVDGDRDMCSWYSDRFSSTRGWYMEDGMTYISSSGVLTSSPERQPIAQPKGPLPLEAGTRVVVLARIVGGKVERLRTIGDDCPVDASGRTVYSLDAVTPAESLRFLTALAQTGPTDRSMYENDRQVASSAVRAIGYHRDAAADPALDRIATDHRDSSVRRQAASTLVSLRGAHGVGTVSKLLAGTRDVEERRSLTGVLGSSRDASVVPVLRNLLSDPDTNVRSEAIYYFIQRGGLAVVPEALRAAAAEKVDTVRTRAISSIGRLPNDAGVPQLLELARATGTDAAMRKAAVSALSQSKDPRAVAYMEELLKR